MEDRPSEFGKYRIDGVLGEGGMGIVYKGYDPLIARVVAIKTIHNSLLEGTQGHELRKRFRREARAVGRLTHQNIIAIYEYEEDAVTHTPYFIMEYVEGREISDCIKERGAFGFEQAISIIEQVLSALGYAHSLGVIHRDIKPANIILLDNDRVKIADFGIARVQELDATELDRTRLINPELTQVGMVLGSPRYMSPEQCLGVEADPRSDLYSTALVLYELVTGSKAFSGRLASNPLARIQNPVPPPPDTQDAKILNLYHRVLEKALAKDPKDRYQTAEEFSRSLRALISRRRQSADPRILGKLIVSDRRRWLAVGGAVLLVSLSVGLLLVRDPGEYIPAASIVDTSRPREPLSLSQQEKVKRLLQVADIHTRVGRLVAPAGSNAYYAFQQVQRIDPQNQAAASGIRELALQLEQQIGQLVKDGKTTLARDLVTEGLKYFPDYPALQGMSQTLGKRG